MNAVPGSQADRLLSASLVVAPVLYLVATVLYALRGWESDSAGGVFHVLGAVAYTLVLIRVATWTSGALGAALLVVGSIGIAGNVAYGFDAIHVALGDVSLVDRGGAAVLIKPLGLGFPLMLLMCAIALRGVAPRWTAILIGLAALAFPIANIGNIPALGVADSIAAVVGFGALAVRREPAPPADADPTVGGRTTAGIAS
ncbi:hypothetical protein [Pseudofrankia sp. BMG5.37]|uniref:hypothetical protein n=1 Tax=Pseudofrankia sp. BMG5.37 TaxID=3050035 RepID=UPI0028959376|nr:hypothetical protein [Pseudofrankia sp. BMG5.37]MDT3442592.1 hypothetical protein [Pseudofrankia sp. BMG5.37]